MTDTKRPLVIALDGPSGAGKSTLARGLAEALGLLFLDTGAMYRALGHKALTLGIDPGDEARVARMLAETELTVELDGAGQRTRVDGRDVSALIRSPEVSLAASAISALPVCRAYCVARQRELAAAMPLILDGRDIGTYVLPEAPLKFFVTADVSIRAQRRYEELRANGSDQTYDEVRADMERRDRQDRSRALAPTRRADDAILIDTGGKTPEALLRDMLAHVCARLERGDLAVPPGLAGGGIA